MNRRAIQKAEPGTMQRGAVEYFGKPFNAKVLLKSVRAALNRDVYDAIT
jgi:FixJ family two-component response regulator